MRLRTAVAWIHAHLPLAEGRQLRTCAQCGCACWACGCLCSQITVLSWYTEGLSGKITATGSLILFLKVYTAESFPPYPKTESARQSPAEVGRRAGWQHSSTQTEHSSAAEQRRVAPAALTAAERLSIIILL